MKVNDVAVVEVGGRYAHTFTPKTPNELVSLSHIGGIGDTSITGIQIEKGTVGTPYVEPTVTSDNITGIFEDLRAINVEMTDPKSQFWSSIKINNEAYLREFGSDMIGSMAGQTADSIYNRVENKISGEYASFELRMAGLQQTVQGEVSMSVSTQLQGLFDNRITDIEGNVSQSLQIVNAFQNQLTSIDGRLSSNIQTVQGFQQQVYGLDGAFSSVKQRVEGLQTEVVDAIGNVASLTLLAEGLQAKVTGVNGLESKYTQLAGVIETKVTKTDVEGIIRNSGNDIWLVIKDKVPKMTGSDILAEISLSPDGVRIAGDRVTIDANTFIKDAVIKSSKIESLVADKITTGVLNGATVNFINMNGSSLTTGTINAGNKSSWDLRTGVFQTTDTYSTMRIENGGIKFYEKTTGALIGGFQANYYSGSNTTQFDFFTGDRIGVGLRFEGNTIQTTNRTNPSNIYLIPSQTGKVLIKSTGGSHFGVEAASYSLNGYSELSETPDHSLEIYSPATITMRQGGGTYFLNADASRIKLQRDLNMSGYNIYGQSDRNLKKNIKAFEGDILNIIAGYQFVSFEWIEEGYPGGIHFGLIAQDTPFISEKREDDIWTINQSKQVMVNTLGVQQLNGKLIVNEFDVQQLFEKTGVLDAYLTNNELEVKRLKKIVAEQQESIEKLKECVA